MGTPGNYPLVAPPVSGKQETGRGRGNMGAGAIQEHCQAALSWASDGYKNSPVSMVVQ